MSESKHTRAEVIETLHRLACSMSDDAGALLDEAIAILKTDGEVLRDVEPIFRAFPGHRKLHARIVAATRGEQ